jgi:subfamily B ATP-binding cassette protein MsbA
MKTYFRLLAYAKPIQKYVVPYILLATLAVFFNTFQYTLIIPLLDSLFTPKQTVVPEPPSFSLTIEYFKNLFNYYFLKFQAGAGGKMHALQFVSSIIVAAVFLSNLFRYLSQTIMENFRIHTLENLRNALFRSIMNMDVRYFNNQRKGDIITKMSSDVQVVQFTITASLQVIFKEPLQLVFYFIILFYMSSKLTLFSLLLIPVSGLVIARLVKSLKDVAINSQGSLGLLISYVEEALSSIKIIKAFNGVPFITNRFRNENNNLSQLSRRMVRRQQLASPTSEFLGVLTVVGLLLYGGGLVLDGELKSSVFITYLATFSQVLRPAKAISDSFGNISLGLASGVRILEMIDIEPTIKDKPNAQEIAEFNKEIRFESVSFSYGDQVVLKNLNFSIPKGKMVALVGPSGGGKTTISDIIPRFYDVTEGRVLLDDVNVRDIKLDALRAIMGLVSQESVLFNDTIYNNIVFSNTHATKEEVEEAAKIANAHNFILATEHGYNTKIGDRGVKLSGGQRQRLNIARAVLKNPPILILDEATSALDTESEKLVQQALDNLMKNRTSLVIAHRLSTIQNADHILVLEGGVLVEEGTHQQLLEKDGLYKRLVEMQSFM